MSRLRLHKRPYPEKPPEWVRPLPAGRVRFAPSVRTAGEVVVAARVPDPPEGPARPGR